MFNHVMLATAGGDESLFAFEYAHKIGLIQAAKTVTILSCFEDTTVFSFNKMEADAKQACLNDYRIEKLEPIKASIDKLLGGEGPEIQLSVVEGRVETALPKFAATQNADLLILGRREYSLWPHLVNTRLAERLIPQLDIPVLVCPVELKDQDFTDLIAVATDLSIGAREGEELAIKLAKSLNRPLHALTVLSNDLGIAFEENPALSVFKQQYQQACAEALEAIRQNFDQHFKFDRAHGVKIDFSVSQGKVSDEIANSLKELKPQLLVLTSHGRSGLDRLLLGSQAEKLLRLSPCALLIKKVLGPSTSHEDLP